MEAKLPSLTDQKNYVHKMQAFESIKAISELAIMQHANDLKLCYRKFDDGFKEPNLDEINEAFKGFTNKQIANICGTDDRNVRRWKSGERGIAYPAWRLFLIVTGKAIP